jgi:hypothetical protein
VANRIDDHMDDYLEGPRLALGTIVNQFDLGLLDSEDLMESTNLSRMERYLWRQSKVFDSVSYLLVANEQKEFVGLEKLDDGNRRIDLSGSLTNSVFNSYSINSQGNRDRLEGKGNLYDPHTRPYYQAARVGSRWSDIYLAFSYGNRPTITAVQPIYDASGKMAGVVGADLILSQISQFLEQLDISRSGVAFIVEPTGKLVATSTQEAIAVQSGSNGQPDRRLATASQSWLISGATQQLQQKYGSLSSLLRQLGQNQKSNRATFAFRNGGEQVFVEVRSLKAFELDWLIVIVIPEGFVA